MVASCCLICGGHLKQKCDPSIARSKFEDFEAKVPYIPGQWAVHQAKTGTKNKEKFSNRSPSVSGFRLVFADHGLGLW